MTPPGQGDEIHDVRGCARCGGDHDGLAFREFSQPVEVEGGEYTFERFAICPENGEPILMRTVAFDGRLERLDDGSVVPAQELELGDDLP